MKREGDFLWINNIKNEKGCTSFGDNSSKRKISLMNKFPEKNAEIAARNAAEYDDLERQGVEIIIPSNITDIWSRLEVAKGLKLNWHNGTLTEASALIDEFFKEGELQNERKYRNALDKFRKN